MLPAGWPLVGREAELERVRAHLAEGAHGVVLAGPAGVGKSRLAAEGLTIVSDQGLAPLRVSATQAAASLPLGAFAPLLPNLVAGMDRTDVLRETARAITDVGNGQRVAVLVDDAHLLDDISAALTHQLATGGLAFVIATVRTGEPVSDAITALWKDGLAERIDVEPLSYAAVEALLPAVLGGPTDHATVWRLHDRTEGNVLFLRELVEAAVATGALHPEHGLWRLSRELPASERLAELVDSRLHGLSDVNRQCLRALAIAEPLGVDLLTSVAEGADIEMLEQRGLLRIEASGRRIDVRLGHPIYGEVLRARLSPLQNRALSRALADVLEATGPGRREDVLRLAVWRLASGDGHDPALLLAGARQAFVRHDIALAERLARAAWEGGGGFDAGVLLGVVLTNSGKVEQAGALLEVLVPADDRQRTILAESRIENHVQTRRYDLALGVAEEAEASVQDRAAKAALGVQRARMLTFARRRGEAMAVAEAVRPQARGRTLMMIALMLGDLRATEGQLLQALEINAAGLGADLGGDSPYRWVPSLMRYVRTNMLTALGRLDDAEDFAMDKYAVAIDESDCLAQGHMAAAIARVHIARGRVTTGATWARLSERLFREDGRTAERGYPLIFLALALALAGKADAASEALAAYASLPGAEDPEMGAEVAQARAWQAVASGDLSGGRRLLGEGLEAARGRDSPLRETVLLHDLARLGRPAEAAPRLRDLAGVVDGALTAARADHAAALLAGDPGGLDAASASFEEIGTLLLAAEAAAEAAVAWRRSAEVRKATVAERRAHELVMRCEGATTPALATCAGARAALTPRELEIACLAAQGVSNRDIAARLYLSLHTVENKLHVAYEKLGITGRRGLPSALRGL